MSEAESKQVFQKKFNQLLEQRHITQKEVAAVCGASTSTVSTWSKGTNMPRMDKIERLAAYFDLPKSYFIEENAVPAQPTDEDIKFALFGGAGEITDEMYEEVKSFAEFVRKKYQKGRQ